MNYNIEFGKHTLELTQNDLSILRSVLAIIIVLGFISIFFILFTTEQSRKNIRKYISMGFWINIGILFCNVVLGLIVGIVVALLIFT